MMTDAELNVLYGAGLKPATAMRVIDELRRVKAELLDWQIRAECWNSEAVEAIERLNALRGVHCDWCEDMDVCEGIDTTG